MTFPFPYKYGNPTKKIGNYPALSMPDGAGAWFAAPQPRNMHWSQNFSTGDEALI
jgi:hypothetical protein